MLIETFHTLCLLAPWLIVGALFAGLLHVLLPVDWLRRRLTGRRGVLKAVMLGVPLPLCSCGVIPTGVGLKRNGASDGASIGFLISTPQTGVDSILVSASFLGWPFAFYKMLLAAITGIVGGLFSTNFQNMAEDGNHSSCCDQHRSAERRKHSGASVVEIFPGKSDMCGNSTGKRLLVRSVGHSLEVIQSIWIWLAVGILVSAAISVFVVPANWFQSLGQQGLVLSLVSMLIISIPLYVCATASVPVAAALVAGGMPTAAALVFLIAGPATNLATIGAIYSQFGMRNCAVYLGTIVFGSIGGAVLFDAWFGDLSVTVGVADHTHMHPLAVGSGLLLLALFAWFAYQDIGRILRSGNSAKNAADPDSNTNETELAIPVRGMSCQNCVRKIESSIRKTLGPIKFRVDLEGATVVVEGNIEPDTVRDIIRAAGFQCGD